MTDDTEEFYTDSPVVPKKKKTTVKLTNTANVSVDDVASPITPTNVGETTAFGGMAHGTAHVPKTHGYGHETVQRLGSLRLSGHTGAHRIGKR